MIEYIDIEGKIKTDAVDGLVKAVSERSGDTVRLARRALGADILGPAGLSEDGRLEAALDLLPAQVRDVFERVALQVQQLQKTIEQWSKQEGGSDRGAVGAMTLKRRLLGLPERGGPGARDEADDRGSGHPMRRFAEFGILPGYEFPTEPATLRLSKDDDEEEPIPVERRFGISQYEPDAPVHARGHRWRVRGLDTSSPWNPRSPEPTWIFTLCETCGLRFGCQAHVKCPRCGTPFGASRGLPAHEFGGFLATRDDTPVLEEEDRFARANRVGIHPQRDGDITARYDLPCGWRALLRQGEEVRWVNEGKPPSEADLKRKSPILHTEAKGFYLCAHCGRSLRWEDNEDGARRGRRRARTGGGADPYGHAADCARAGQPPASLAIVACLRATVLRIEVVLPLDFDEEEYERWGQSLGYSLRTGMRHLYMLDGREIEFCLESMWEASDGDTRWKAGALTFIDGAVGGSGFLDRAAVDLHLVAGRALMHLDHADCETACYRCLKSYANQRVHDKLCWPAIVPDLQALAADPPVALPAQVGDRLDPKPWLEAFAAGCGSPLELKFLRMFEQSGIEVEKQVPVAADEGGPTISTTDFVLKGKRVAIYVDGAAFHTGNRLRRDRFIRKRLREGSMKWRVVEARARDLADSAALLALLSGGPR